jgi:xanthine/uracil permease
MEEKNSIDAVKGIHKTVKSLNRMMMFLLFVIKVLKYGTICIGSLFVIGWIMLLVAFIWTINYHYLKLFFTIPIVGVIILIICYALIESIKISQKAKQNDTHAK